MIVDLDHEVRSLSNRVRHAGRERFRSCSGRPPAERPGGLDLWAAKAWITWLRCRCVQPARFAAGVKEQQCMVHNSWIAWMKLHRLHVLIGKETQRDHEALKNVLAIRRDMEGERLGEDRVRLARLPTGSELRRYRFPLRVAFGRSIPGPLAEHGDLLVRKAPLVLEMPVPCFCFPRRHRAI